ncbi:MAG: MCE family protein [Magnetococcales bacterium]|nr:MCE family protein [Magnetococcales bacterium]
MSEGAQQSREEVPMARVTVASHGGPQLVWLIPLVAFLLGGWLVYKTWSEMGPKIVLTFKTAEGIEAGKTRIKHKAVDVGVVESVVLSPDFSHVEVHAALVKGTEPYLTNGTKFWVVRPRLSMRGVSGLGTLVAGSHIEMEIGTGTGQWRFAGLESPPPGAGGRAGEPLPAGGRLPGIPGRGRSGLLSGHPGGGGAGV